jgi:hypothetical protein
MLTNRRLVLILALPGLAVFALALALLNLPLGLGNGSHSPEGVSGWGFLILVLGYLVGGGLLFAAYVVALVQTARIKRWGWFGGMLGEGIALLVLASLISFYAPWVFLILPVTLLIYGVLGPNAPVSKVA